MMTMWDSSKAKDLVTFKTGKLDSNAAEVNGTYPFFTCAQETYQINSYAFDTECVLLAGNNAAGIFPLKYFKGKFNAYQRTYIIEPKDKDILNTRFLYESFKLFLKQFEQTSTGATTKFLTMGILNNLWLPLPPLPTQKKIAAILSAYDDLIENNTRRIALLERMAEELYKEWFVRMRFPGHEQTRFVKGIPEGWESKKLGEVIKVNEKSIKSNNAPQEIEYIDIASVSTGRIENTTLMPFDVAPGRARRIVRHGDVIWSCVRPNRRSFALIMNPSSKLICSTGFAVLTPKTIPFTYLYYTVTSQEFSDYLSIRAKGAAYPAVTTDDFEGAELIFPNASILNVFHGQVAPLLDQKELLLKQNQLLKQTRDRLLTRLISGKLSVEDLDISFPPSMLEDA